LEGGALDYWQAWLFLLVFFGSSFALIRHFARYDPQLLERRMTAGPGAEQEKSQQVIQLLAMVTFIAMMMLPAIDHHYRWSTMPPDLAIAGDILIAFGFAAIFLVFKENSYASAVIEVRSGQKIVTTGPYAVVRHPMYSGALIMLLGIPLALGSWWDLFTLIPITIILVWRLLEEEKFLATNLPGYSDYQNKVSHRLVPFFW
jgi:protein-S-isoprenylcysteine O-methyltransferase Ste14